MRTVFITGASRGIGQVCAQILGAEGYRVVLGARNLEKLEQTAGTIREAGGVAHTITIDMASQESISAALGPVLKELGGIDVLVNNAGITKDGLAVRMKAADWDQVLATNLTGAFYAIQLVLPRMMRERWGRIINISSVVGESGNAGQANYAASKAGLIGLTKALAQEVGSRNITVNAVAPGYIETEMTQSLADEIKTKLINQTPLRRMGTAQDVAQAVKFLASDDAAFITGHVLDVNGGMYM